MLHRARQCTYGDELKWDYRKNLPNPYPKVWYQQEPKWWRKMMKHRKRRATWRTLKHSGRDWEDVAYPLDVKPWIYYW